MPWQAPGFVVGADSLGAVACTAHNRELRCAPLLAGARPAWVRNAASVDRSSQFTLRLMSTLIGNLKIGVRHQHLQCFDQSGALVVTRTSDQAQQLVDVDHDGTLDSCGIAGGQLHGHRRRPAVA